jgi:hypothetical protein
MDPNIAFLVKICREILKKIDYQHGPLVRQCSELLSIVFQNK